MHKHRGLTDWLKKELDRKMRGPSSTHDYSLRSRAHASFELDIVLVAISSYDIPLFKQAIKIKKAKDLKCEQCACKQYRSSRTE